MEDVEVDKKELEAIEKEVLAKKSLKEDEIRTNIEAKLRKEMQDEKLKLEQADELKQLKEKSAMMETMLKEKELESQKEIEILKSQIGQSKAIHGVNSDADKPFDSASLDEAKLKEINVESLNAFLEAKGMTKSQWNGR
jgi:hypothetical protein